MLPIRGEVAWSRILLNVKYIQPAKHKEAAVVTMTVMLRNTVVSKVVANYAINALTTVMALAANAERRLALSIL